MHNFSLSTGWALDACQKLHSRRSQGHNWFWEGTLGVSRLKWNGNLNLQGPYYSSWPLAPFIIWPCFLVFSCASTYGSGLPFSYLVWLTFPSDQIMQWSSRMGWELTQKCLLYSRFCLVGQPLFLDPAFWKVVKSWLPHWVRVELGDYNWYCIGDCSLRCQILVLVGGVGRGSILLLWTT